MISQDADFIALDTETGGFNSAECALLSIAAVPSWTAPPFLVYILPVGRIDARAAEVNGYTSELWEQRGAMTPKSALLEFMRWLEPLRHARFDMAAHNAGFDLRFMAAIQQRTGIDLELPGIWHCTKTLMQEVSEAGGHDWPKGCSLDDLGLVSGFWEKEPRSVIHDALQDARCCAHGLRWLRNPSKLHPQPEAAEERETA